ncbi:MAG: histidine phosphatase family protein [Chloroflexi bacterium]|nr:histidine phosphatase family protein [Chloroflexota bacterium]
MHFYLVRHAQSFVNLPDWDGENWDQVLTPLGEKQAKAVAAWIAANLPCGRLFASTLARTRQTAEEIGAATGLPIEFDTRLREVGTNAPDGNPLPPSQLHRYIEGRWGTLAPYDAVTEHGENWMQFRTRVGQFIESQIRSYENHMPKSEEERLAQKVLVVCHGGVIEAFFEYVFEKGPWSVVSVITQNTGIVHMEYRPVPGRPEWRLYFHNRLEHLTPDLIS